MKYMKININEFLTTTLVGSVLSFISPIMPFIYLVVALIFADLYSGIRRARFEKKAITSRGLSRTVEKMLLYFSVILISEGMLIVFNLPFPLTYVAALAISLSEFKSLLENTSAITGVSLWSKIKELFNEKSK
jgi:hypothetical protein